MGDGTGIEWTALRQSTRYCRRMGSLIGTQKAAAARLGLTLEQYQERLTEGEKWCTGCKAWHPVEAFPKDRHRADGRRATCREHTRVKERSTARGLNPATGRPGPAPHPARDGDKRQARQRINVEVRTGRRPHPNTQPCTDCGHVWTEGERRHEYDHHQGYDAAHHLDVQPVCTTCHHRRETDRG